MKWILYVYIQSWVKYVWSLFYIIAWHEAPFYYVYIHIYWKSNWQLLLEFEFLYLHSTGHKFKSIHISNKCIHYIGNNGRKGERKSREPEEKKSNLIGKIRSFFPFSNPISSSNRTIKCDWITNRFQFWLCFSFTHELFTFQCCMWSISIRLFLSPSLSLSLSRRLSLIYYILLYYVRIQSSFHLNCHCCHWCLRVLLLFVI